MDILHAKLFLNQATEQIQVAMETAQEAANELRHASRFGQLLKLASQLALALPRATDLHQLHFVTAAAQSERCGQGSSAQSVMVWLPRLAQHWVACPRAGEKVTLQQLRSRSCSLLEQLVQTVDSKDSSLHSFGGELGHVKLLAGAKQLDTYNLLLHSVQCHSL